MIGGEQMYNFFKFITNILFKIFYRVKVEGHIDLQGNQGYMICSNHIHMFDPVLILTNHKRPITFMVKKEAIDIPIVGKILLKCGAFPVDRSKGDICAIKTAIEVLKQNKVLSVFPEGTRHRDGKFRDVKKGASLIAIKAESIIVPVRIIGNYRLFSKMTLRIGEPINAIGYNKEQLTEKLREAIDGLE
jgi:1-acyl-sn-glycerol-3-phosphate acyltransferase